MICRSCHATDHDVRKCPSRISSLEARSLDEFVEYENAFWGLVDPTHSPLTAARAREIEARGMAKLREGMSDSMILDEVRPDGMTLDEDAIPSERAPEIRQTEMFQ